MALWDALSGKVLHFNRTKENAHRKVCAALKSFVPTRAVDDSEVEESLIGARNSLLAFFMGASHFISRNLEDTLTKYRKAFYSLNESSYLCLICALHTGYVVHLYLGQRQSEGARGWFGLLAEGICEMYYRPENYMVEWINRLEWIAESEDVLATRLSFKVYDEIAPIMGLATNDAYESNIWDQVLLGCARSMRVLYDHPEWNDAVEAELAAN